MKIRHLVIEAEHSANAKRPVLKLHKTAPLNSGEPKPVKLIAFLRLRFIMLFASMYSKREGSKPEALGGSRLNKLFGSMFSKRANSKLDALGGSKFNKLLGSMISKRSGSAPNTLGGSKLNKLFGSMFGNISSLNSAEQQQLEWSKLWSLKLQLIVLLGILGLGWFFGGRALQFFDATAGSVDPSIWLLVVLSLICFLLMLSLSWWIFKNVWNSLGFPPMNIVVSQFSNLSPWQQLSFFYASFALLLLAAIASLSAVL